jgi:hypothetical protein
MCSSCTTRMLAYAGVCWRMLTYAEPGGGAWRTHLFGGRRLSLWRMLMYADGC